MTTPLQAIRDLLVEDPRYRIEAYQFIRESLHYAHENFSIEEEAEKEDRLRRSATGPKHVTGQQLCEACRRYAIDQYGYLAKMVLSNWGIRSTSDLGELVYNLIRIEQMRKSDSDRREDFNDVFDFGDAFEPQFELVPREADQA
ncbi:Minf_1886 family protein [Novipirellula artificiosorum]|uniref:Uncharacterized protein n=1 Tax=Novipirellula artificiosorum TaxID=2528016 RepID=A0A5C6E4C8_9BACT|nr:Minf_1886 family protein [Novipirellula artificiosorum]TWU42441.1 hypothetical protein Poly41_07380 [Novipirellula artificiosorum]